MKQLMFFAVIILLAVSGAQAAEIRINAGGPLIETYVIPTKSEYEKKTGNTILFEDRGFKNGLENLEKGSIDMLQSGFAPQEFPEKVRSERIQVKSVSAFKITPVAEEEILVAINRMNPVQRLSKQQLKDIFTGKTRNWKDVGGDDMPITVVWGRFMHGPNQLFISKMLDGAKVFSEFHSSKGFSEAKAVVRGKSGAIMIYPTRIKDPVLKFPEVPKLVRSTIFITKGEPNPAVKSYMDFLVKEVRKGK